MNIALASDHAGFELKEAVKRILTESGHIVTDFGPEHYDANDDYPDFILPSARAVAVGTCERGIILGGSGQGEAMVANRVRGIRAVVYYGGPQDILDLSRAHNDANMLSLGARFMSEEEAHEAVVRWLDTPFSGEERHVRRIHKIDV
jgi:ribose 5-phosphate isomerase B